MGMAPAARSPAAWQPPLPGPVSNRLNRPMAGGEGALAAGWAGGPAAAGLSHGAGWPAGAAAGWPAAAAAVPTPAGETAGEAATGASNPD